MNHFRPEICLFRFWLGFLSTVPCHHYAVALITVTIFQLTSLSPGWSPSVPFSRSKRMTHGKCKHNCLKPCFFLSVLHHYLHCEGWATYQGIQSFLPSFHASQEGTAHPVLMPADLLSCLPQLLASSVVCWQFKMRVIYEILSMIGVKTNLFLTIFLKKWSNRLCLNVQRNVRMHGAHDVFLEHQDSAFFQGIPVTWNLLLWLFLMLIFTNLSWESYFQRAFDRERQLNEAHSEVKYKKHDRNLCK